MGPIQYFGMREGELLEAKVTGALSGMPSSTGIYYVIPIPEGWWVASYRYKDTPAEIDHRWFWWEHVSPTVASSWSIEIAKPYSRLLSSLREHPYAFPRGCVALVGDRYHVYHGSDLSDALGVNPQTIEAIFGIRGKMNLVEDEHEHCRITDKDAVRDLLRLEQDWSAV